MNTSLSKSPWWASPLFLTMLCWGINFVLFGQEDKPYSVKKFSASAIKNLKVRSSGGYIQVTGQAGAEARVEMYVHGNNSPNDLSKEEIEERLKNFEIVIAQGGDNLQISAKPKEEIEWKFWRKKGLNISFKIFVAQDVNTDVSTSGGSIKMRNLSGGQKFSTSGGSIDVEDLDGNIYGRTSGGSIRVAQCKQSIDLSTSGGSITAEDLSGTMRLTTSGGSIRLENLDGKAEVGTSGGSITAKTVKGSLSASTSGGSLSMRDMRCTLNASSSAGSVDVEMTELGKSLSLSSSAGSVRLKLPMDAGIDFDLRSSNRVTISFSQRQFSGNIEKDEVQGKLKGGGIPVKVRATAGSISVN
jgi:hypothetical protein